MTAYLLGPTVAHVARYKGDGEWGALCYHASAEFDAREWYAALPVDVEIAAAHKSMPLQHTGTEGSPTKPWCRRCQARVRQLYVEVFGQDVRPCT